MKIKALEILVMKIHFQNFTKKKKKKKRSSLVAQQAKDPMLSLQQLRLLAEHRFDP